MHLREGEQILKVYRHHPTPFVFNLLKILLGTFPFYLMLFLFQNALSQKWYVIIHLMILFVFALIMIYASLVYWLDKLVVTNQRVVQIDWKYLTLRNESEALLSDIQDIQTKEKGIFSALWIFDYGSFELETASANVTLYFEDAPDPEGIRRFVYHVRQQ